MKIARSTLLGSLLCLAHPALAQAPSAAVPAPSPLPGDDPLPPMAFMLDPSGPPPAGLHPPAVSHASAPPLAVSLDAAKTAIQTCLAQGVRVGVAISDTDGNIRVALAADGAAVGRIFTAARKNLAALAFNMPTSRLKALIAADPTARDRVTPGMAIFGGGVPITVGGKLLGAVGVSGGTTEQDEMCATAAARALRAAAHTPG